MEVKQFFFQLLGVSSFTFLVLFALHRFDPFLSHQIFSWISLSFFILFSMGIYYLGRQTAGSTDINAFTRVILLLIGGKMFFSILLVAIYVKINNPQSRYFLVPFLIIYLLFTIFETYFMSRIGQTKHKA